MLRVLLTLTAIGSLAMAQAPRQRSPAVLEPAPRLSFPVETDSNSPVFWRLHNGMTSLNVLNSTGAPTLSGGKDLNTLTPTRAASMNGAQPGGWWMEAV